MQSPRFATTRWSVVLAAGRSGDPEVRAALEILCETYWYPVYYFLRRSGHDNDAAQDLTQGFFARLIEKRDIASANPQRGRFRNFLLGAVKHYVANERVREQALKRGGPLPALSLTTADAERLYAAEPVDNRTPDKAYERRWALMLLQGVMGDLRGEYEQRGDAELFDRLKFTLTGDDTPETYAVIAASLGVSESAVKVGTHRLRRRYRERLWRAVAETVADQKDVQEEIRALIAALGEA